MRCLAAAVAACLAAAPFADAQSAQAPAEYLSVTTVTVRPDAVAEFEDYARAIRDASAKTGAPGPVTAFQVLSGGPGFTYVFSQPFARWSEVDTWASIPETLRKAHGETEGAKLLKAGRATTAELRTEVYRYLPELSTRPARTDPTPYVLVYRSEVRPEKVGDWQEFLRQLKAAQEKESGPMAIRRVSVQGRQNTFVTVVPFSRFAERDGWATNLQLLEKANGKEEARRIDQMRLGAMDSSEVWVLRFRPDLSRPAPASK